MASYRLARIVTFSVLCLVMSCAGCPPSGEPLLRSRDTFMIAFRDDDGRVRVRWSQDGYFWEDASPSNVGSDTGVGLAASDDAVGVVRVLAFQNPQTRLATQFGLGAGTWDSQPTVHSEIRPHGMPSIAQLDSDAYLITTAGGTNNAQGIVQRYHQPDGSFTIETPPASILAGENENLRGPPNILRLDDRLLLGWLKFAGIGNIGAGAVPVDAFLVAGEVVDGSPQWSALSTLPAEPGFSQPISEPALAQDRNAFLVGVIRNESGPGDRQDLFIYRAQDGQSWTRVDQLEDVAWGDGADVGLAAKADGTMVVVIFGVGTNLVMRRVNGEWEQIRNANVFGNASPAPFGMTLITAGRPRSPIYVDANATGPSPTGYADNPFHELGPALEEATRGDTVKVRGGVYTGSITLPKGVVLEPWEPTGTVLLNAPGESQVITAEGDNTIRDIIVADATIGLRLDLGTALSHLRGDGAQAFLRLEGVEVRSALQALEVRGPLDLAFSGDHRMFLLAVDGNLFTTGTGIFSAFTGPSSGSLSLAMDVRNNVFETPSRAIVMRDSAQVPPAGGFINTSVTGWIYNNLVTGARNGFEMVAKNGAVVAPIIAQNTIAGSILNGLQASARSGPDGNGRVNPDLGHNIIVGSGQFGYFETDPRTRPRRMAHNLFFDNDDGHYFRDDTGATMNSAAQLNGLTFGGDGHVVTDPNFDPFGGFCWRNAIDYGSVSGDFYLDQAQSPAVDAGGGSAQQAELDGRTTSQDQTLDQSTVDLGFHYAFCPLM